MPDMLQAALEYARKGWRVFPLAPKAKTPLPGSRGFKDATTDEAVIKTWWTAAPNNNIGIATGEVSGGLIVLDVDGHEGHAVIKHSGYEIPDTLTVVTGRDGGRQYYLHGPHVRNFAGRLDCVDLRGDGGYVVAPPSIHPNGREYEFADPDVSIAKLPEWIVALAEMRPNAAHEPDDGEDIPKGQRNDRMFRLACRYRSKGMSEKDILTLITTANHDRCKPPLDAKELHLIAKSAAKYDPDDADLQLPDAWGIPDEVYQQLKKFDPDGKATAIVRQAEIRAAAKANDGAQDKRAKAVTLEVVRYEVEEDGKRRAAYYSLVVSHGGVHAVIRNLRTEDLLNPKFVQVRAFERGLTRLPAIKPKAWREMIAGAFDMAKVADAELQVTAEGACVETFLFWLDRLKAVTRINEALAAPDEFKLDKDDCWGFSADHARRFLHERVKDAKRRDITGALNLLGVRRGKADGVNIWLVPKRTSQASSDPATISANSTLEAISEKFSEIGP